MVKLADVKVGDKLIADDGFTCIPVGAVKTVQLGPEGLYIPCSQGEHYLDGQCCEHGILVGLECA